MWTLRDADPMRACGGANAPRFIPGLKMYTSKTFSNPTWRVSVTRSTTFGPCLRQSPVWKTSKAKHPSGEATTRLDG